MLSSSKEIRTIDLHKSSKNTECRTAVDKKFKCTCTSCLVSGNLVKKAQEQGLTKRTMKKPPLSRRPPREDLSKEKKGMPRNGIAIADEMDKANESNKTTDAQQSRLPIAVVKTSPTGSEEDAGSLKKRIIWILFGCALLHILYAIISHNSNSNDSRKQRFLVLIALILSVVGRWRPSLLNDQLSLVTIKPRLLVAFSWMRTVCPWVIGIVSGHQLLSIATREEEEDGRK